MSKNATRRAETNDDPNAVYAIGPDQGTGIVQPSAPENFPATIGVATGVLPLKTDHLPEKGNVEPILVAVDAPILTIGGIKERLAKAINTPKPGLAESINTDPDGFIFPDDEGITYSVAGPDSPRTDRGTILELPN